MIFNTETVQLKTDVLIIGGGSSGMWAAKRAAELHPDLDILIIDKGPKDWGGLMSMSEGDFDAVKPGKDLDLWMKDLVYYWDGLCDQKTMKKLFSLSYARLADYQQMGVDYLKHENGSLKGIKQRGLEHICLYPTDVRGGGGECMSQVLTASLEQSKVRRLGHIMITDLLTDDSGAIAGAIGFHIRSGTCYQIQAHAVLLASGRGGWKASYGNNTATGEWIPMALKVGAKARNFEFVEVWNVPKLYAWEGQTILLPLGARYINADGEPFMERYSPKYNANTDPHYITMAMAFETRAGRGPIYFDLSQMSDENKRMVEPTEGWQLLNHQKLCDLGMNFFTSKTEWVPQLLTDFGGLDTDFYGSTGVPGLFAAGRSRSLDNGVYMGGFDLSTTSITGYLAGEGIVQYLQQHSQSGNISDSKWKQMQNELYKPINTYGLQPKEVLRKIQEIVFPYTTCILKTQESLLRAVEKLHEVKIDYMDYMAATDPHYLARYYEVRGVYQVSELFLQASLLRRESRAGHFREDIPYLDEQYLGWFLLSKTDSGELQSEFRPLDTTQLEYPIERYYSKEFQFPVKRNDI